MTDMTSGDALKRLLVINPNTNPRVTSLIRSVAERLVTPGIVIEVVNPTEGPVSIESVADRVVAEPKVIEIIRAASRSGRHGYVLACFDDIGLSEARQLSPGPVLDACEAGIMAARSLADRFTIVTTVDGAVERIERLVERYSASAICTVRAAGIGVADAASGAGEDKLNAVVTDTLARDGAQAIVLGSGGLTSKADDLARRFNVPVVDGVAAAISICQSVLRAVPSKWQYHM